MNRYKLHQNQHGLVSIMVTMILMIVLSLIVLGFAQISRRNQTVTLDRQLSTQAFYAAESGINDALNAIKTSGKTDAKTTCPPAAAGIFSGISNVLDAAHGVSYSCLLVNPTPTSLQYDNVGSAGTIMPLITSTGTGIKDISIVWQSASSNPLTNCPSSLALGTFKPNNASGWQCGYGILRFDLVDVTGNQTANSLQSKTMTTFAVPLTSGGTNQISFGANTNATAGVHCTNNNCTLKISGGLGANEYYLRASMIYNQASVLTVTPHDASGSSVTLANAQALIDSTGKAQDVLRRIQVRVPYNGVESTNQLPMDALASTDSICKRFSIMDNWVQNNPGSVSGSSWTCLP